ncbi:hypothetical protein ACFLRF_05900 [Candidatus Altiarchaeota archaeon]
MKKPIRKGSMTREAGIYYLINDRGERYAVHAINVSFWRICDGLTEFKDIVATVLAGNDRIHAEPSRLAEMLGNCLTDLRRKGLMA